MLPQHYDFDPLLIRLAFRFRLEEEEIRVLLYWREEVVPESRLCLLEEEEEVTMEGGQLGAQYRETARLKVAASR